MNREIGSLGKDVAGAVAQALGKPVVHHEIIDHLASKMRLRKSHVTSFLEGKASLLQRLTTDQSSLSIYTDAEIFSLAERDDVSVIRGWGATHLFRSIPHVISVRVCAPAPVRLRRMMERLNSDDEEGVGRELRNSDEAHGAIEIGRAHV